MKPLTIHVDDVTEAAQPWEAGLSREDLDEVLAGDLPTEFHAAGAAGVRARLTRMGRKLLVQAAFRVPLAGACKRCLKDVSVDEPVELTLTFVHAPEGAPAQGRARGRPAGPREGSDARDARGAPRGKYGRASVERGARDDAEPSGSFDLALADEETYSGKTLDLAPVLREQILLAVPPSPLCSESCRGLCPLCGQDKNLLDCGHRETAPDPRWAALQSIRLGGEAGPAASGARQQEQARAGQGKPKHSKEQ